MSSIMILILFLSTAPLVTPLQVARSSQSVSGDCDAEMPRNWASRLEGCRKLNSGKGEIEGGAMNDLICECQLESVKVIVKGINAGMVQQNPEGFRREISIHQKLNEVLKGKPAEAHIPRLFGVHWQPGVRLLIVMESFSVKGLSYEIDKAKSQVNYVRYISIVSQMMAAISAVHSAGFVHADVKGGNMVAEGGRVAAIDFGFAEEADGTEMGCRGSYPPEPWFIYQSDVNHWMVYLQHQEASMRQKSPDKVEEIQAQIKMYKSNFPTIPCYRKYSYDTFSISLYLLNMMCNFWPQRNQASLILSDKLGDTIRNTCKLQDAAPMMHLLVQATRRDWRQSENADNVKRFRQMLIASFFTEIVGISRYMLEPKFDDDVKRMWWHDEEMWEMYSGSWSWNLLKRFCTKLETDNGDDKNFLLMTTGKESEKYSKPMSKIMS